MRNYKHYVRDENGVLQVRELSSLFEHRGVDAPASRPDHAPVVKMCPHCGQTYTQAQLEELLNFAGDDKMCGNDECNGAVLIDPEDRSGRNPDDPDIS